MPDAETWIQRKQNAVFRWGHSTWYIGCQFDGDYKRFAEYHAMSGDEWSKYTIEGGGYPIFVKGVEGVVGAVVVVGADLDGMQAHGVIVRAIEEYKDLRDGFRSPMRTMTVKWLFVVFAVATVQKKSWHGQGEYPWRKLRPVFTNGAEVALAGTTKSGSTTEPSPTVKE
jgi:hypothetical protein